MKEDPEGFPGKEKDNNLIRRYEKMRRDGNVRFMDVSDYEEIINAYIDKGQFEKAGQAIRLALHQHPGSVPIRLKEADLMISLEKYKKALDQLNVLIHLDPQNYEVFLLRGIALSHLGRRKEAIKDFEQSLSLGEEVREDIAFQIGNELEIAGWYADALPFMRIAYQENEGNLAALFDMGFIYEQLGKNDDAIKMYEKLLDEDPFDLIAWGNLGKLFLKLERYEEALDAFEYQLAIHENNLEGLFNKGRALMHMGRFDEAAKEYRIYASLSPHDINAMINLGSCYREIREYGRALSWFKMAITEDAENPLPYFLISEVYALRENWEEAENYCRKALELDGEDDEIWFALFRILEYTGTPRQRLEVIDMITALAPDTLAYWLEYLVLLYRLREKREFEIVVKRAEKYLPEAVELLYMKGIIHIMEGKMEEGEELFIRAWASDPSKLDWFLDKFHDILDVPGLHEFIKQLKSE